VRSTLSLLTLAALLVSSACAISDPTGLPSEIQLIHMPAACAAPAPLYGGAESVPGAYIVVFRSYVADPPAYAQQLAATHEFELRFVYTHALRGFAASMSDKALAEVRCARGVHYVEQDQVMRLGV
jgi:hypothetical protein